MPAVLEGLNPAIGQEAEVEGITCENHRQGVIWSLWRYWGQNRDRRSHGMSAVTTQFLVRCGCAIAVLRTRAARRRRFRIDIGTARVVGCGGKPARVTDRDDAGQKDGCDANGYKGTLEHPFNFDYGTCRQSVTSGC